MMNTNNIVYLRRDIVEMIVEANKEMGKTKEQIYDTLSKGFDISIDEVHAILNMTYEERVEDLLKKGYAFEAVEKTYSNVLCVEDINRIYQTLNGDETSIKH